MGNKGRFINGRKYLRIQQCKMLNKNQEKRFKIFFKKYSLKKYKNVNKPSVFFSLWSFRFIKNHKSFALIIWRGTDIIKLGRGLKRIKKMKNVYHIAISSYIAKDLEEHRIKYKFIPVVGVDLKYFEPCLMGNEIYTYIPEHNSSKYYNRYGMGIIKKIQKKCKYKINIVIPDQYNKKELVKIYSKCFCGLRMTKHDGLPNQVIEMGLMGRRSFYNGNIPGSIKWNDNIDQIIENIEKEAMNIGSINYKYAEKINNFIDIGDKWLNTAFWE